MRENTGSGYHFHRIDIICETRQCFAAVFLRKIITAKKSSLNAVFMVIAHSIFNYDTLSGAIVVYERQILVFRSLFPDDSSDRALINPDSIFSKDLRPRTCIIVQISIPRTPRP
jgi:hypothetical protein